MRYGGRLVTIGLVVLHLAALARAADLSAPALQNQEAPLSMDDKLARQAAGKIALQDYWGAIEDADKALAQNPENYSAYYYRAAAHNLMGLYDDAVQDATRALTLNPEDAVLRDTRAFAFNRMGRFHDAIADSRRSLEINPVNAYALANLGYSHEKTGDYASMLRELKKAAQLDPRFESVYRDTVARHGFKSRSQDEPRAADHGASNGREQERRRSFFIVIASSLIGGLLIGLGFFHLTSSRETQHGGASPRRPSRIDAGYALGRSVGMGGMGVVYEALDRVLQRRVAIKMMRDEFRLDPKALRHFMQEARTVAELHHPNIVDIFSIIEDEAGVYLIFEFIEGRTVEAILRERGRLTLAQSKAVLKQVCRALDFAHRRGVVHRDLKPSNIMIAEQGLVKVMDFGISRHAKDARLKQTSPDAATVRGTPCYMAPEQEFGIVRRESDVFSLGACLYEMLAGRRAFSGADSLRQKKSRDYERPSRLADDIPAECDALIDRALEPDPNRRIRSVRDFWAGLERIKEPAVSLLKTSSQP